MRRLEALIVATSRMIRHTFEARLAHLDLSTTQANILAYLDEAPDGPLNQTELAERIHLRKAATGTAIHVLTRRGYVVQRTLADDRRARVVELTPAGRHVAKEVREIMLSFAAAMRRGITRDDRRVLANSLLKISENVAQLAADESEPQDFVVSASS